MRLSNHTSCEWQMYFLNIIHYLTHPAWATESLLSLFCITNARKNKNVLTFFCQRHFFCSLGLSGNCLKIIPNLKSLPNTQFFLLFPIINPQLTFPTPPPSTVAFDSLVQVCSLWTNFQIPTKSDHIIAIMRVSQCPDECSFLFFAPSHFPSMMLWHDCHVCMAVL